MLLKRFLVKVQMDDGVGTLEFFAVDGDGLEEVINYKILNVKEG